MQSRKELDYLRAIKFQILRIGILVIADAEETPKMKTAVFSYFQRSEMADPNLTRPSQQCVGG